MNGNVHRVVSVGSVTLLLSFIIIKNKVLRLTILAHLFHIFQFKSLLYSTHDLSKELCKLISFWYASDNNYTNINAI